LNGQRPIFHFVNYAAINDARRDEKGNLMHRRAQPHSLLMPVIMLASSVLFLYYAASGSNGSFTPIDAIMLCAPMFFALVMIYSYLKNDVSVIFSDDGITVRGALKKKRFVAWQDIDEVSSFSPPSSGAAQQGGALMYFRSKNNTVFAISVLMYGFADFFNFARSKLGEGFQAEFSKVIAYYKRSRIDLVNKRVLTVDPFESDSPFEGF